MSTTVSPLLQILRNSHDIEGQVLQELGIRVNKMWLRTEEQTAPDDNLGIQGQVTVKDKLIKPNPEVKRVNLALVEQTNGYIQLGDCLAYISGNVKRDDIENAHFVVYDTDSLGNQILWKVIKVSGDPSEDLPESWKVLLRVHKTV